MFMILVLAAAPVRPVPAPGPDRDVVLAKCVSVTPRGDECECVLEVMQDRFNPLGLWGRRVAVRRPAAADPELRRWDRTYLIVSHRDGREVAALVDAGQVRRQLGLELGLLYHPLECNDGHDRRPPGAFHPGDAATYHLACAVNIVLRGRPEHVERLVRDHRDNPYEVVRDYVRSVETKLRQPGGQK